MIKTILFLLAFSSLPCFGGLYSSILLFNGWDLEDCPNRIEQAVKQLEVKNIQIMPTLHFKAIDNNQMQYYCLMYHECIPMNEKEKTRFHSHLNKCLETAKKHRLEVLYTPHLDATYEKYIWRNNLVFDPLKKYQGYHYKELLFDPLKIFDKHDPLHISLQGEMGATLFAYPNSHRKILRELKNQFPRAKLGVSLNYNSLNGNYSGFKKNLASIQALINHSDFIGISAYAPVPVDLKPKHLKYSFFEFFKELKKTGLSLSSKKPIYYVEIGLGGGNYLNDGRTKAKTLQEAFSNPYAGIRYLSQPSDNPWLDEKMIAARRNFHQQLIKFIRRENSALSFNRNNPVTKAYLWNANSWDPQGLYPNNEDFKDLVIIDMIQNQ
jgi:hypothetical protein